MAALQFDLNLLPIAVALYEERSVTLAAKRLGMSQPAVSKALARLRTALGDPLFIKTGSGMDPTTRATAIIGPAREVLSGVHRHVLSGGTFDPAMSQTPFTLSLSAVGELFFFPRLVRRLRDAAPNAAIKSIVPSPDALPDELESGRLDVAIGVYAKVRNSSLFRQRLFTCAVACLVRRDAPIRTHRLTVKQYLSLSHIEVRAGRSGNTFEEVFGFKGVRPNTVLVTSHFLGIPKIVEDTGLVATIPRPLASYFCAMNPNLKTVAAPGEIPPLEIQQLWHRKFNADSRNRWLRGLVKDVLVGDLDTWFA